MEMPVCREIGVKETLALLSGLDDVEILIHRSPDGDCVGGGYALHHMLKQRGIRSRVCCVEPISSVYAPVTEGVIFEDFEAKAIVAVDVADRKLFGDLPQKDSEIVLCIDHHVSNKHYATHLHWDPDASAACEVLYALLCGGGFHLTKEIALCLYLGMATDTGCFQYSNAGAACFAAVAEIKRQYPDLPYARFNRALFVLKSRGRLTLDARLMQSIRISADGKAALIYVPACWMTELGLTDDDTEGVSNLPMQIQGVEVGITVKQKENGSYRISMRGGDHANVSVIAQRFGGGGHIKASGCSISEGTPEAVCDMLMETAESMLREGSARDE